MQFVIPEKVVSHFHIRPGDRVADFGAGTGYFLKSLSAAVGDEGAVYACEIQKNLVETMDKYVSHEHLPNVRTIWCDFEKAGGSKIEDDSLDLVIMVNTLFQIEDKPVAIAEALRVLRTGGRFVVVDWTESWAGIGPEPAAVFRQVDTEALLAEAGCTMETTFPAGDHHYGITFRK